MALPLLLGGFSAFCTGLGPPAPLETGPNAPFALRDPRAGIPVEARPEGDREFLEKGMAAVRAGDSERAASLFAKRAGRSRKGVFRLGLAYAALLSGSWDEAETLLEPLIEGSEALPAAIEAKADLDALQGHWREALARYRVAARSFPGDSRIAARLEIARQVLMESLADEARDALVRKDLDEARRVGLALVDTSPREPEGYELLARTAAGGGKAEDAWTWAVKAGSLGAKGQEWKKFVASLAMTTGRFAEAEAIYAALAADAPAFAEKAEEARREFRIENLPEGARSAARSSRVTRAEVASLLWWIVPEVRAAAVISAPDVATDVVDRPDMHALVRAIGLGFFRVSRETHHVRADEPVSRPELWTLLKKLGRVVARGGELPPCLSEGAPSGGPGTCGILPQSKQRTVSGKEALRAIERTARMARDGGNR